MSTPPPIPAGARSGMGEDISADIGVKMVDRSVSDVDIGALAQKAYDTTASGVHLSRERTILEHEVIARHDATEALIKQMGDDPTRVYFPSMLNGAPRSPGEW